MSKTYKIKCRFYIDGIVEAKGNNKLEAMNNINNNLGLCLGGNIHTSTNEIVDWEFPIHFEKKLK